jgi:hypothetical protein
MAKKMPNAPCRSPSIAKFPIKIQAEIRQLAVFHCQALVFLECKKNTDGYVCYNGREIYPTVPGLPPPYPLRRNPFHLRHCTWSYHGGGGPPPSSLAGGRSPRPSTTADASATTSWPLHRSSSLRACRRTSPTSSVRTQPSRASRKAASTQTMPPCCWRGAMSTTANDDDGGSPPCSLFADNAVDFCAITQGTPPPPPRPLSSSPDDGHNGVPQNPPSSAPDNKSNPPIPLTSPCHLHCRFLFLPRPPPSCLLVSSVVAPDTDDNGDDDNAVSMASTATTTAARGSSPPGSPSYLSLLMSSSWSQPHLQTPPHR